MKQRTRTKRAAESVAAAPTKKKKKIKQFTQFSSQTNRNYRPCLSFPIDSLHLERDRIYVSLLRELFHVITHVQDTR
jgi:hypothetical protein